MIKASEAYAAAVTGTYRRTALRAVVDILDPDITFGEVTGSEPAPFARPEQLHDMEFDRGPAFASLEPGKWILDGSCQILPDNMQVSSEIGTVSAALSDEQGVFNSPQIVELQLANVDVLQVCSVYASQLPTDGVPVDGKIEILQGGTVYHTHPFSGNESRSLIIDGFTVYNPDLIRVTVTRWSLPRHRARLIEILPGIHEIWDEHMLSVFDVAQRSNFHNLSLAYGTCVLAMDNSSRRFEPRYKSGLFKSLEAKQGIKTSIGVQLPGGSVEYMPLGVYYQANDGWKVSDNALGMTWSLVDIIGLLATRKYIVPAALPTTLSGWIASIVGQLGPNFAERYHVDPDYAALALTCTAEDLRGITCGDLLLDVCLATATWPRADAETGALTVEPYWQQGNKYTLDNLAAYPSMEANEQIAAIAFDLGSEELLVSGESSAAEKIPSVSNPFIRTRETALVAARQILSCFGGNRIELLGRGDPSSEIGDVDTVWLDESSATTARRTMQSFTYRDGVLAGCQSLLLQADGAFQFEACEILTADGEWTAPAGCTRLRVIVVGGGQDGEDGTDGTWDAPGTAGTDGVGGRVWAATININPQQKFGVRIGHNGAATSFGDYTSANGEIYPLGYTDIVNGNSYARSGVPVPLANSGDGGKGGAAGKQGRRRTVTRRDNVEHYYIVDEAGNKRVEISKDTYDRPYPPLLPGHSKVIDTKTETSMETVVDGNPTPGRPGAPGGSGCIVVCWDKEEALV